MSLLKSAFSEVLPLLATLIGVGASLPLAHWFLLGRNPELGNERRLPRQLTMLVLTAVAVGAIAAALPVSRDARNQISAALGLLASAVVAFSSTTIVANLMGGVMLRVTRPFRTGDFIKVQDYFGRVSERGLLDTEIQTERRELISLPNVFLATSPVTVVRSSGAIISVELSLGYDVHHAHVEKLLLRAAAAVGLEDPFMQVLELGNFSITYRVSGLLTDVKSLISTRSRLSRQVLDELHGDGVEIVSPMFMNQRPLKDGAKVLPTTTRAVPAAAGSAPEEILFDKAEEAEEREQTVQRLRQEIEKLESRIKKVAAEERPTLNDAIEKRRALLLELRKSESGEHPEITTDIPEDEPTPDAAGEDS